MLVFKCYDYVREMRVCTKTVAFHIKGRRVYLEEHTADNVINNLLAKGYKYVATITDNFYIMGDGEKSPVQFVNTDDVHDVAHIYIGHGNNWGKVVVTTTGNWTVK